MRVLTYNLQKGQTARKHLSFRGLGHAVAARSPDILFCQEVMQVHGDDDNQCSHLASALAHDHAFGPNAFYDHGCHGNATFTGHKLAEHRNHDVTHSRLEKRGILQTELIVNERPILAFNVHFSLTARQRRLQWSQLVALLDQADARPMVICGDFNDWTGELDRTIQRAGELQGALWHLPNAQRRTFPARRPLLALDRIYYRNLELVDVSVLRGAPWSHLSDHLPLEASFKPVVQVST